MHFDVFDTVRTSTAHDSQLIGETKGRIRFQWRRQEKRGSRCIVIPVFANYVNYFFISSISHLSRKKSLILNFLCRLLVKLTILIIESIEK